MKTNIFVLPNHVQPPLIKHGVLEHAPFVVDFPSELNLHTLICHLGGQVSSGECVDDVAMVT